MRNLPKEWYRAHALLSAIDAARCIAKTEGWWDIDRDLKAAWQAGLQRQSDTIRPAIAPGAVEPDREPESAPC